MQRFLSISFCLVAAGLFAGNSRAQQPQTTPKQTPSTTAGQQAPTLKTRPELQSQKDKLSYALGMVFGTNLHRQSVPVDPDLVMRGLKDSLAGGQTLMTEEEAHAALLEMQNQLRKEMQEKMQVQGESNKKEGEAFLAANKTKEGVVTLPSGLQYKILQAGTGPKPAASDTVTVNYRGTLVNGKEFDSSYKRGQPSTFAVTGVIKGWTEALQLMPVGSKWQLVIPPNLAYGERGPAEIGPNATLIFDVELIKIVDKSQSQQKPQP